MATATIPRRKAPGRPTLDDSAALRDNLLNVALAEFLQHGYEGAGIDAIARKSGIGRVTIYRVFGSKEGLFRASVEKRGRWIEAGLRAITTQNKPPRTVLREIVERIHEDFMHPEIRALVRLSIAEAERFPDVCSSNWETGTHETLAPVVEYLERLKSSGVLDLGNPEQAAFHLVNLAIGGFRFLVNPPLSSGRARRQWAQGVLDMLLPALEAGTGK